MHIEQKGPGVEAVLAAVERMGLGDLERVREAADRRRGELSRSGVLERRPYADGVLQLEYRRNPKTGTRSGPYWYFKYRRDGRQRTEYVGKDLEGWMERRGEE
jgi:hypothetical protein